ncbi:hypothetical protein ABIA38_008163 [Embleya sp. AB8]
MRGGWAAGREARLGPGGGVAGRDGCGCGSRRRGGRAAGRGRGCSVRGACPPCGGWALGRRGVGLVSWLALGRFGGAGSWRVAAVSSLLVPSGAGVFAWCSASVVARPLRGRCRPGRFPLTRGRGSLSVGRRGVGLVAWWPWVRSAGPGRGGGRRLVVARPLRGRGFCLVLRIRCCPSTTWPLPPGTASSDSRSGAVVHWASGCSAAAQAVRARWGWVAGVAVCLGSAGSGSWVGCVSGAWVSGGVRGLFCLVVPRFRVGEHETRTRRPARTRVPGKAAGQASSRALGVSSGSVFGPEERAGAVRGCETRHGHRPLGPPPGQRLPTASRGMPTRVVTAT